MGEMILRKPAILYETIEAIYQRVNGITFSQKKRDILLKYGQKLSGPERNRIELLCSHLSGLVEEVCGELPESPQLTYYFQRWDTESKWQNMCLAKLMIYSFLDIRIADFQEALAAGFSVNDNFLFINFRLTGSPDFNNKHFFFFGQSFLIFHFLLGFFVRNADRLFAFSPALANLFLFLFLFQGNFLFG